MIPVLTIRDLEESSGVPRTTIHYYLSIGLLPRPQKTARSRSLYTRDHLDILREIVELKQAGLALEEIQAQLQHTVDRANNGEVDLAAQEHRRVHDRILALAAQELVAKGYRKTHVTTIVRKLGITTAVFYSHFPSKRALLSECVSALLGWGLEFVDAKEASTDDPAERLLWLVFGHSHVFQLGSTAMALTRVDGVQDESDPQRPMEALFKNIVEHIKGDLAYVPSEGSKPPAVPDELVAHSLFGAYEQTVFRSFSDKMYTREDLLLTHLWLFLAVQAARSGEIDVDSRLDRYRELVSQLATQMPPLPPLLQNESTHDRGGGTTADRMTADGLSPITTQADSMT